MEIGVAEIRHRMADTINRVAYAGERVVLQRRGKGVAALVSMEDLKWLEAEEDRQDIKAARKARKELQNGDVKAVSWEQVKKELGM